MKSIFFIDIASDLSSLKQGLSIVLTQIKSKKPFIPDDDFMDLRLIFTELLSNAIIHGNKYDIEKKVHVVIEFTDKDIRSKISDEGDGFNYAEVLSPKHESLDFLLETGRGINLVKSLADELIFNSRGNEIKFLKKVADRKPDNIGVNNNSISKFSFTNI